MLKLTQKQADALERLKSTIVPDELFGITTASILEAMKNGYEIKREFSVGDWAKDKIQTDEIGKIIQVQGDYIRMEILKGFSVIEVGRSSHSLTGATIEEIGEEQERRKWAAIGREISTLKKGDIVYTNDQELYVVHDPDYQVGGRISILSADRVRQVVVMEHEVTLVCPVENQFEHGLKL